MNEFLNPKSMLTPGAAGAFLMFLVNGICFSFPELGPRYVALGLSFVIGLVSFAGGKVKPVLRPTLWVLNSLIIFTMGMGAAQMASTATGPKQTAAMPPVLGLLLDTLAPAAHAQDAPPAAQPMPAAADTADPEVRKLLLEQQRQIEALKQQNAQLAQAQAAAPQPAAAAVQHNGFFKEW